MTATSENKSTLGLRDVHYALVTQDDADAYAADTPTYMAPVMTASATPAANSLTQYADDGPYDVFASEGETKIDLEFTGIPFETQSILLGKEYDSSTGRMFDNGGTPPDVALSFRSKKSNGSYRYFQYLKGKFSAPTEEQASQTDTPDPKNSKITFTAVKTIYQFDLGSVDDGVKRVVGDEDATGFSGTTWFDAVQVPVVGSAPSLTCTPSPADGATGVAASVSPTLTFSNPLSGSALNGISLVRVSTGAAIAVTKTINAARTVITIDPVSNLASGAQYLIVVSGVVDVYGQAFATTVYDFTIA